MSYDVICSQCHGSGFIQQEQEPIKPASVNFNPQGSTCYGCGDTVSKKDRQDIAWDTNNTCRRVCEKCIYAGFYEGKVIPKG